MSDPTERVRRALGAEPRYDTPLQETLFNRGREQLKPEPQAEPQAEPELEAEAEAESWEDRAYKARVQMVEKQGLDQMMMIATPLVKLGACVFYHEANKEGYIPKWAHDIIQAVTNLK